MPVPSLDPSMIGKSANFMPKFGDDRRRRHAQGNWPAFVQCLLPGPLQRVSRPEGEEVRIVDRESSDDEDLEHDLDEEAETLLSLARKTIAHARSIASLPEICEHFPASRLTVKREGVEESLSRTFKRSSWGHLSLARPFYMRKHEIEPFRDALQEAVGQMSAFEVEVLPDWVLLPSEDPDSERSFIALKLADHNGDLARLVTSVDSVMARFGRPKYFTPAIFHVTIAEIAARIGSEELSALAPQLRRGESQGGEAITLLDSESSWHSVRELNFKAGKHHFAFSLKPCT